MYLKPTASVFCLKRNHRNLSTEEYADNLCSYLCSARSCKTVTVDDLNNVMHDIAEKELLDTSMNEIDDTPQSSSQQNELNVKSDSEIVNLVNI